MKLRAFAVAYRDDRLTDGPVRTVHMVTADDPRLDDAVQRFMTLEPQFKEAYSAHYAPTGFLEVALADLPSHEKIAAVGRFAAPLGIVVLDYESEETMWGRLVDCLDGVEVTPEMVKTALAGLTSASGSIPLVTETEEGEAAVRKAAIAALVDAKLIEDPDDDVGEDEDANPDQEDGD